MRNARFKTAVTLCCFTIILTMLPIKGNSTRANAAMMPVQSTPDFTLTLDRANVTLKRGTGFLVNRTIQAVNRFSGTVTFHLTGNLPVGVHTDILDDGPVTGSGSSAFGLQSDKHNFVLGAPATCFVVATSGNISHSAPLTVTIK